MSKAEYIRKLINGYIPKEAPPYTYYGMTNELKAIGNNLNQIAYVANDIGYVDAEKYKELAYILFAKIAEIEDAVLVPEKMKKG